MAPLELLIANILEEYETILYVIEYVSVADTEPTLELLVLLLIENE